MIAENARAQLLEGRKLATTAVRVADSEDRKQAIAIALGTLDAVRRYWPAAEQEVAAAGILEAELLLHDGGPIFAIRVADESIALLRTSPARAELRSLKAQALVEIGDTEAARQEFEKALAPGDLSRLQEVPFIRVVQAAAEFEEKHGSSEKAATIYRRAAVENSVAPVTAALFHLRAATNSAKAGSLNAARQDHRNALIAFQKALQAGSFNPGQEKRRKVIEQELDLVEKMLERN